MLVVISGDNDKAVIRNLESTAYPLGMRDPRVEKSGKVGLDLAKLFRIEQSIGRVYPYLGRIG